jgi:hypothetical protein
MARSSRSRSTQNRPRGFDRRTTYVLLALALMILLIFLSRRYSSDVSTKRPAGVAVAPDVLGGIPREGKGGDPELNLEKNRIDVPSKFEEYTPAEILALGHALLDRQGREHRAKWDSDAKSYLERMEATGVHLTGYLIYAKESGPESCNGYIDSLRDYHIWVGDSPDAPKSASVVVEVTPRWKVVHPEWRLHYIEQLAKSHAKVRVSGWLMWDEEHPDEVGKSRGSQWEVHPVTGFETL